MAQQGKTITTKMAGRNGYYNDLFSSRSQKGERIAMKELSHRGFLLWCFMMKNQDGYTYGLTYEDVHDYTSMNRRSYYYAVDELIEKNYLVRTEGDNYTFYEIPQEQKEMTYTVRKEPYEF